jgi:hypothetical protein
MDKNIHTQLLEFKKQNITIKKNAQGVYNNKYANLDEILEKVTKPLYELDVIFYWRSTLEGLELVMHHTGSKTEITSQIPYLQKQDAQKLGSNITYNKRYSIVAMLGLEDDDDDGQSASTPSKTPIKKTTDDII